MRPLKVYGGCLYGTHRVIVAARTKKEAYTNLKVPYSYFAGYFTETGNKFEVELTTSNPGTCYIKRIDAPNEEYIPFVRYMQ